MLHDSILTVMAQGESGGGLPALLTLWVPMLLIIYFVIIRPQSRERKKRTEMLAAIKKNDKVVTAGGIKGTVTALKDNEITLKVDESTNTKITFDRSSIQRVETASANED